MAMNGIKNHYGSAREMQSDFLDLFDGMDYSSDALNMFHEDSPEQICSAMETGMEVIRLMANLPPPLKNALLLREAEGMRYDEIAARMECPVGTVRSRIHRVRAEIRKLLEKDQ